MPRQYRPEERDDALVMHPPETGPTVLTNRFDPKSAEKVEKASVIWLHGLGADGYDFAPIVQELPLPETLAVRFVFPHAPMRPVTINNGMAMRAWYDIKGLSLGGGEDDAGIRDSASIVEEYIAAERAAGVDARRIALAGFSQGGAIALHVGLRHKERLGGILALSTYLPLAQTVRAEASPANKDIPVLMCHGTQDPVLPLQLGTRSRDTLRQLEYKVEWKEYPMQHQVCLEEIEAIGAWLGEKLGEKERSRLILPPGYR